MTFVNIMEERIASSRAGSVFVVSDFTDVMDYEIAKKNVARMEQKGLLRRVSRGIYDKPQYSELLQEYAAPNINLVAYAIARNYKWTIAPTGDTALNQLGLSTQVPAKWSYISSGPYKKYEIGNVTIDFVHRADRELSGMSNKTRLVIQAIKEIGKDRIGTVEIEKIRSKLNQKDKKAMLKEGQQTIAWIYTVIKEICMEK